MKVKQVQEFHTCRNDICSIILRAAIWLPLSNRYLQLSWITWVFSNAEKNSLVTSCFFRLSASSFDSWNFSKNLDKISRCISTRRLKFERENFYRSVIINGMKWLFAEKYSRMTRQMEIGEAYSSDCNLFKWSRTWDVFDSVSCKQFILFSIVWFICRTFSSTLSKELFTSSIDRSSSCKCIQENMR